MNVSREEQKIEAIKRMKKLHIIGDAIEQFKDSDTVMISEPPFGALYWLNEEQKKMVAEFENGHSALVYMVIRTFTEFGMLDNLLFVSDYPEEWEMDNESLSDGYPFAYVVNHDVPEFSEFGSICVKESFGGLLRVG